MTKGRKCDSPLALIITCKSISRSAKVARLPQCQQTFLAGMHFGCYWILLNAGTKIAREKKHKNDTEDRLNTISMNRKMKENDNERN